MIAKIKAWFYKRKMLDIQQFTHAHRRYLVMVFDPKDDTMFMAFRDKQISGKISSADGVNHKVVRNVLKHSTFEREIDRLLGGIIDTLKCPLKEGNTFYSFIDGGLFNIVKSLFEKKR